LPPILRHLDGHPAPLVNPPRLTQRTLVRNYPVEPNEVAIPATRLPPVLGLSPSARQQQYQNIDPRLLEQHPLGVATGVEGAIGAATAEVVEVQAKHAVP
jgi:hypothetical protein